jgi:hypothetical protein
VRYRTSEKDLQFRADVESCNFPIEQFNHSAHLRLAYTYLAEAEVEQSYKMMKGTLLRYLNHNGVDSTKFHETITKAWIMAIDHFLNESNDPDSSDTFIHTNPVLLDPEIMLTHYSEKVLFSGEARTSFVAPDRYPIPARHH